MATKNKFQILKPFLTILLLGMFCILFLTACGLPASQQGQPSGFVGDGVTVGVAILSPVDGEQLKVGDFVDVHSQIADPAGITAAILTVNGNILRRDQLVSAVASGGLFQPWLPAAPGTYVLQVVLETSSGSQSFSNQVTVFVSEHPPETIAQEPEEVISVTPTYTNTPGDTITPTLTFTPQTPTDTPTPEAPMAASSQTVNCRSGPGTVYSVQGSLHQGETVPVVGYNNANTWWVVELQNPTRQCWVLGSLVEVSGYTGGLRAFPDPPTPTFTASPTNTPKPPTDTPFPVSPYSACHDYPDLSTCLGDPNGFGGCSWDTGMNKCQP